MSTITAYANSNIALIKYWGKIDQALNLPAVGSLSFTLSELGTKTQISLTNKDSHSFILNGQTQSGESLARVANFLEYIKSFSHIKANCEVVSENSILTNSGLASSASGFAALTLAASKIYELNLNQQELSKVARFGSASAARSIFGGLVYLPKGQLDNDDCKAYPLEHDNKLDLQMIIIHCSNNQKVISSREAMNICAKTSTFYKAWLDNHQTDLDLALKALKKGNFTLLGECMERSTLKMHACMLASNPSIFYLNEMSFLLIQKIYNLRQSGLECYFTMDAGPHVKVLCKANYTEKIKYELEKIKTINNIFISGLGKDAYLIC